MDRSRQSDDSLTIEQLRNVPVDWERVEEERELQAAIEYMLSLTPAERLRRNETAVRAIKRLEATAARYGLRAVAWTITGPDRSTAHRK